MFRISVAQGLELLLLFLVPFALSVAEYLWTDFFLAQAAKRVFATASGATRYYYSIVTAIKPIPGLSFCFMGLALDMSILLNYPQVATFLQGYVDPTHLVVFITVLLTIGVLTLVWATSYAQAIYSETVFETVEALRTNRAHDAAIRAITLPAMLARGRRRRQYIVAAGALSISLPLFVIFLIVGIGVD